MPLDITIRLFQYFFKQFIWGKIQDGNDELSKSDSYIYLPVNITTENGGFMKITDFNKSIIPFRHGDAKPDRALIKCFVENNQGLYIVISFTESI